jgi:hypothetical protein
MKSLAVIVSFTTFVVACGGGTPPTEPQGSAASNLSHGAIAGADQGADITGHSVSKHGTVPGPDNIVGAGDSELSGKGGPSGSKGGQKAFGASDDEVSGGPTSTVGDDDDDDDDDTSIGVAFASGENDCPSGYDVCGESDQLCCPTGCPSGYSACGSRQQLCCPD